MTKKKERKLTRKEQDAIKELSKAAYDKNHAASAELKKIDGEVLDAGSVITREMSDKAGEIHRDYQKQKKSIDQWKKEALKQVETDYQNKLNALRSVNQELRAELEATIENGQTDLALKAKKAKQKVNDELQKFTTKNLEAQMRIRGVVEEEPEPEPEPKKAVEEKLVPVEEATAGVEVQGDAGK
jgi:hypothetical protein